MTLPDGYFEVDDLNNAIQLKLIEVGAYLIDSEKNNVYFIKVYANPTYYSVQVDFQSIPTTLPSGFTRPPTGLFSTGGSGLPASGLTMRMVIPTPEFGNLLGFESSTMPAMPSSVTQFVAT
ncbi:hypothetical protein AaE_002355 [Aphanomyces astaci]|uniref:Uncharacterized protein n=1 Tax=Aphanomyces astaci TaxID=112090 RepID=A0A6A5ANX8_APHAT|nr:hypothetical protein AaE_002355 [Aphanomyces astaci]